MKKLIAALALLTLGLGVAPAAHAAPVRPAVTTFQSTNCDTAMSNFGTRLCYDPTTAFGPVLYIYANGGTTATNTIGVSGPGSCNVAVWWSDAEWFYHTNLQTATNAAYQCTPGNWQTMNTLDSATAPAQAGFINVPSASFHDLVEWYSATPGYEFIIVR